MFCVNSFDTSLIQLWGILNPTGSKGITEFLIVDKAVLFYPPISRLKLPVDERLGGCSYWFQPQ